MENSRRTAWIWGVGGVATGNHANTDGLTAFFRGCDVNVGNNLNLAKQIGVFINGNENVWTNQPNPQKVGEWANYTLLINQELKSVQMYINDKFIAETALPSAFTSANYLSIGGTSGSVFDNLQIGEKSTWKAVAVGNSSLIGQIDYSDTFTYAARAEKSGVESPREVFSGDLSAGYYQVEYSREGLTSLRWKDSSFGIDAGVGAVNYSGSNGYNVGTSGYGGFDSYAGADTGFTQRGGNSQNTYLEYGNCRSQFIIQCDMIQTSDYCALWAGTATDHTAAELAVLFRSDGKAISLVSNGKTYELSPATTTVSGKFSNGNNYSLSALVYRGIADNQWNNYAIRVDTINMELELFANEISQGTFDLTEFGLNSLSAANIGYAMNTNRGRTWADNVQVGGVVSSGVTVGTSSLAANHTLVTSELFRGSTVNEWFKDGAAMAEGLTIVKDSDNLFAGSRAGSATGAATAETGALYLSAFDPAVSMSRILVQSDAVMNTGFMLALTDNSSDISGDSLGFLFNSDETFTLDANGTETDVTAKMSFSGDLADDQWYNFALLLDTEANTLEAFINEQSIGNLNLDDYGLSDLSPEYVGFLSTGLGYVDNFQAAGSVPEPTSCVLILIGALGLIRFRRRLVVR